jgi:hypothetical protein
MATAKRNKASRILNKLFSDAARFDAKQGKYSSLPWVLRTVLWLLQPRTWQVYTYVVLRSGQEWVTWLTDKQMAVDLGITHRKVRPHIRELEKLGLLKTKEHDGERYVCVLDPLPALDALVRAGKIHKEKLERLNEDLETIGLPTLPLAAMVPQAEGTPPATLEPAPPTPRPATPQTPTSSETPAAPAAVAVELPDGTEGWITVPHRPPRPIRKAAAT